MTTKSSGFTLIELLVVIAIIGILSAAGTITYSGYVKGAKRNSAENVIQQISLAQTEEYSNTGSYYITGGDTSCSADATSTQGIETNLFDGESIIDDDIDFEVCIFGTGANYTVSAQDTTSTCVITVTKYGTPERTNCN
jgi:prepilin-type N-terminal cleavage/methylation domain-containing protein